MIVRPSRRSEASLGSEMHVTDTFSRIRVGSAHALPMLLLPLNLSTKQRYPLTLIRRQLRRFVRDDLFCEVKIMPLRQL
jgi:hypothetical protein